MFAVGFELPKKNILLSTGTVKDKADLLESVRKLKEMSYELYATGGTQKFLEQNGIKTTMLNWPLDKKEPNALTYLKERKIDFVVNIPKSYEEEELENDYMIRRASVDFISLITNVQNAKLFVDSISKLKMDDLKIKDWDSYE